MRIVWTPQAIEDVEAIRNYIAQDSPRYGDHMVERIVEAVERLEMFPRSGRVVPELKREAIREVIYGNYRIVYRVTELEAQIITVFHAARRFTLPDGP